VATRSARKRRRREIEAKRLEANTFDGSVQVVVAGVREMAQEDVLAAIPEAVLRDVREVDPHPLFVAVDIAQEGESTGEMMVNGESVGSQRKLWPAAAIQDFAAKLKRAVVKGVARLWHGGSHNDKKEVGRLLGGYTQKVGSKLHAIAVGWIHDPQAKAAFAAGKITTGSMEADAQFERRGDSWLVRAVKAVQGAVLAGQGIKPGFAGATVLASVQELKNEEGDDVADDRLTLRDVQDLVEENGWDPSKVFGKETLLADRVVADALGNEVKTAVEAAVKEKESQLAGLKDAAGKWARHEAGQLAGDLLEKSELVKDLPKPVVGYLKRVMAIDLSAVPEAERQAKVDERIQAQLDVIKETGIKFDAPAGGGGSDKDEPDGDDDPDAGDEDQAPAGTGGVVFKGKDMTDPKNNPQIPKVGG